MPSIKSVALNLKQYAMVAAGGVGLTGGRAPSGPLQAQIGICDPCNHECVFCWDHPPDDHASANTTDRFGFARPGVMPLDQFKGIVDDLHKLGTRQIDMTGRGEPLLNRSAMDMVRYVKSRGMRLQIVTNGSRLFQAVARDLVAAKADRLNVSLNAGTAATYPTIHVTEKPEDYLRVKANLRYLADCKAAANSAAPFVSLSFVITSRNFFEIDRMIEATHEVGAQEAQFAHSVVHPGTNDLKLSQAQFEALQAALPAVIDRGAALGVRSNLAVFQSSIPPYMPSALVGPAVVPCYVGWYFAIVLGNGSVLPCCQSKEPIDRLTEGRRFADIWASDSYRDVRLAAKALPVQSDLLKTAECDKCQLRGRNIALHNLLHPLSRVEGGEDVKRFTAGDFVRKMAGRHGH